MEGVAMEMRALRSFLAVVRAGSVTRAAEELHITQPALSRQMDQLERELGCRLLNRGRHGASPTEDGLLLQRRAEVLLELADKTESDLRSSHEHLEGKVSISCGQIAALDEVVQLAAAFRERHPLVSLSLHITTSESSRRRLAEGLADFAILIDPFDPLGLDFVRLKTEERWVGVMRSDDPLADHQTLSPSDLASGPVILPHRATSRSVLSSWFGSRYARLEVAGEASLSMAGEALVRAGLGRCLQIETPGAAAPDLVRLPLEPALTTGSAVTWLHDKPMSRVATSFAQYLQDNLGGAS